LLTLKNAVNIITVLFKRLGKGKGKGKSKVHRRTDHEVLEENRVIVLIFL
jgi:hypothetical protein